MTSTELDLKRTLTDILEDELYNMSYHGQNPKKNVLELSLPTGFDESMKSSDFWSAHHQNQLHQPLQHQHSQQHQHQPHQQNPQQLEMITNQDDTHTRSYDNSIFNKYADPSLTTTSAHLKNNSSAVATTPVQKTVNLNSVMKVANPFHNMRYQLPYDVKITNDYMDEVDSIYSPQADDESIGYDGSYNPKMQWPLQDNNMALSNEDARMIFDHEFAADDDDLSEDDEEDYQNNEDEAIKEKKLFGACDFVDGTELFGQENGDQAIMEDDDDDLIDEDELYEPSFKSNRKESIVTTPPVVPAPVSEFSPPSSASSSSNGSKHKRKSPVADNGNNESGPNEIFTCMILNHITKQPCSAQFSRSYDLTRHQNTIHAKKKTVFRCSECIRMLGHEGYQKTFSRLDALTRHIKSKHENLSLEQRQEVTKYAKENIGYVV
ncbi:RPN4 (YDL020C) [Zygosaccharomyces parabailii]|nr:RPN4 (YDL020C) [Zygosaccharomyces parabailii]